MFTQIGFGGSAMGKCIEVIAPNGYEQLVANEPYHFLRNHGETRRVFLVHFEGYAMAPPKATLFSIDRGKFEIGLNEELLVRVESENTLPPWLQPLEGIDFTLIDMERPKAKQSHQSRVEERLLRIGPILRNIEQIYRANDPTLEIHRYARECDQNESRFRLWLLTYLAFGQNEWTLLPAFHRIGHWDRFAIPGKKYGKTSLADGKHHGFGATRSMIEDMVKGYERFHGVGVTMREIFRQTLRKVFGCVDHQLANRRKVFIHSQGLAFPTYWQFVYWIEIEIGIEDIRRNLYGAVRYRSKHAPSQGKFSRAVSNLLQRIEADGYYTKELPRGYVEGTTLPPLCVVIGRDVLSGKKVGIGFSFGNERNTAYRMMLFSMAVPKVFFCSLFGIEITEEKWTGEGLPILYAVDRGPGAKRDLIAEFEHQFPIKDMAPSWNGQSKATVESSHPRNTHAEGLPTYIKSSLFPVQLAVKEIFRLLKYNDTADMSDRLEHDPNLALCLPSANEIWDHYERRMRTDAQPMSLADAVRTFLSPVNIKVDEHGAWFDDLRYDSDVFLASEMRRRVVGKPTIYVQGYALDMCVRHIWIEVEGRLMLLTAQQQIREDDELTCISIAELVQWKEARAIAKSAFREHQEASAAGFEQRFEETTGQPWMSGKRQAGAPKRSRQEISEANSSLKRTA